MKGQKIEKHGQKTSNFGQIPPMYLYGEKRATADLQISITFSHGKISSFRKKQQFNNKKHFHMNKTCQNDPGPLFHRLQLNVRFSGRYGETVFCLLEPI